MMNTESKLPLRSWIALLLGGFLSVAASLAQERPSESASLRVGVSPVFPPMVFKQGKELAGDPEDFLADPGDWIWIQLMSCDARKAAEFYRDVAGYKIVENTTSNRLSDYVLTSEGYARATVRTIRTDDGKVLPTWLPFVRVQNI